MTPSIRLAVQPLEDRRTPASFSYAAATQTLTITAIQGDQITVAAEANQPTGYVAVTQNGNAGFSSDALDQAVRNLVVRFNTVDAGGLTLSNNLRLGGGLTVFGAKLNQFLSLDGSVGGSVAFKATPGSGDDVTLRASAEIGGNLGLNVGTGANAVRLEGGTVVGNLSVTGGAGADAISFGSSAVIGGIVSVGGSASFALGDGANSFVGTGIATQMIVGGNFTYTGGAGVDHLEPDSTGVSLTVGGDARFTLGSASGTAANMARFEALTIGRNLTILGGAGNDPVEITGRMAVGGSATFNLGAGTNSFAANGPDNDVAGSVSYLGLTGEDDVSLPDLSVGRNLNITLGNGTGQSVAIGATKLTAFGSVSISTGTGNDSIAMQKAYIAGLLTLNTGAGDDTIALDDMAVSGRTLIDLGAGADALNIETLAIATNASAFGGAFTVKGGAGIDTVNLSDDLVATTFVRFGGKVTLQGGDGLDVLKSAVQNEFKVAGTFEDFETGTAVV